MSNEFVMVPRAELVRLQENLDPHRGAVAWGIVCDLLEKPHQGEPVALPARKRVDPFCYDQGRNASVEGWNACLDETAKLGPLYTHSDPSDIRTTRQALESLKGEANDLRVQLAGRDALLREVLVGLWPSTPIAIKINATLSASAEPSAPKGCGRWKVVFEQGSYGKCGDPSPYPIDNGAPAFCRGCQPSAPKCSFCRGKGVRLKAGYIGVTEPCHKCCPEVTSEPVEIDERAEFDAWCVKHGRVVGYCGWREDFAIWQARAALERKS
jgi:hypothetical protein